MPITNFILSFLIEFGPTISFFGGTVYLDFMKGVEILMVATIVSLGLSLYRDKRIPKFMLISAVFVLFSGILTLVFNNPYFTVVEYTLYNAVFCVAAIMGYMMDKPLMKTLFITMFSISDKGWHLLSLRWCIMFFLAAVGNEITWHFYGPDIWIYYRLISAIILAIFGFSQFFLSRRERLPDSNAWGLRMFQKK